MALAVDSEMASNAGFGAGGDPTSPQTFSFTNAAGTLLVLIVGVGGSGGDAAATFGTITYGGQTMTQLLEKTTSGGANGGKIALYYLLSPPTGSNTVSLAWTYGGSTAGKSVWAGCTSFSGNNGSSPFVQSTSGSGTGTTPTVALSGVAAGNITIAGAGGGSTLSAQSQTLTWVKNNDESSAMGNGRASRSASSGSVTHNFTQASDSWASVIAEIAAAGSTTYTKQNIGITPYTVLGAKSKDAPRAGLGVIGP